jgi:DNA-binding MarR family transcriptional regulator
MPRDNVKKVLDVVKTELDVKKAVIFIQRDRLKLPQNIMVFQAFAYMAAKDLKPTTNRLLMLLFSMSEYENFVSMDVQTIAEVLQVKKLTIIVSLKELTENNIVIKVKHKADNRRNDYFLNPVAVWKGNSYARDKAMKLLTQNKTQLELFGEAPFLSDNDTVKKLIKPNPDFNDK